MGDLLPDIVWLSPEGREMTLDDWSVGATKSIGVFLNGESLDGRTPKATRSPTTT